MTDYDYKTPRERISQDFRKTLEDDSVLSTFQNIADMNGSPKRSKNNFCKDNNNQKENTYGKGTFPPNVARNPSLAMIYSPCQSFENLYDPSTALSRGTLFYDLEFPFEAAACCICKKFGNTGGGER